MDDNISYEIENLYLLLSNKEKCKSLLKLEELNENNKIDFLISLHLVLEIGINIFFRKLLYPTNLINYGVIKEFEKIGFKEKTVFFISMLDFLKNKDNNKFNEYVAKLPGYIQSFNEYRNTLLHGHFIGRNQDGEKGISIKLVKNNVCNEQIKLFIIIIDALNYLIDLYETKKCDKEFIKIFQKQYLNKDFLIKE